MVISQVGRYLSLLQWGHDKIVMEVKVKSVYQNMQIMLQWGHDKIVMEVPAIWLMMWVGLLASMGP